MSMLVRKGTMLHRNSSARRHSRRNSTAVGRRERSASLVPTATSSLTSSAYSRSTSSDRRFSRVTISGLETASTSSAATAATMRLNTATAVTATTSSMSLQKKTSSTPSLTAAQQSDSRRASSATSQMSSDDRRKLCKNKSRYKDIENDDLPSYGSFSYELKDARLEASGLCDFLVRVLEIVAKTVLVTVLLLAFMTLAFFMVIFGVQYLRDCPKEPNIPLYLLLGGCFLMLKVAMLLWRQSKCRRYERLDDSLSDEYEDFSTSASTKVTEGALSLFLLVWFGMGNYWVFRIYKPRFQPLLFEPSNWCHKNLYVFALVHIYIFYSAFALFLLFVILLAVFRKAGCL